MVGPVRMIGVALLLLVALGCGSSPQTLVQAKADDTEMLAARERAQSEVDQFIEELAQGNGENFAVKAPITDKDQVEHFWITKISYADGEFSGVIGNDPGVVTNVKAGQAWKIKKEEISDWMFMRDGKMHGNYTLRPLLKLMPEDQAAKMRALLANP